MLLKRKEGTDMFKKNALCFLLAVLTALSVFLPHARALEMGDFLYSVELKGDIAANGIYMAPVGLEVTERSGADFEDLRVMAAGSEEVPFVILKDVTPREYVDNFYSMSIVDYYEETSGVTLIVKMPDKRQPIEIIELSTDNRDFKKHAALYGGDDNSSWQKIAEEPIFDFSSQVNYRKTEFKLGTKYNFKYYKFVINGSSASSPAEKQKTIKLSYEGLDFSVEGYKEQKLKIDAVYAKTGFNVKKDGTSAYDEKIFDKLNIVSDKAGNSVIDLEANIGFERVTFDIAPSFYRRSVKVYFSETGADGSYNYLTDFNVYNIPLDEYNTSRSDLWYSCSKHKFFRFVIENKNNPPLALNKIKFEFIRKNLFFVAPRTAQPYYICFGSKSLKKPEYDISTFINQGNWHRQNYRRLQAAAPVLNASYKEKVPKQPMRPEVEKALLTVIVIIVIAALGYWLFTLMAAVPNSGANSGDREKEEDDSKK